MAKTDGKVAALKQRLPWAFGRRVRLAQADGKKRLGPTGLHLLRASPKPLIDIIFVHGLRGGSVKTWQKGADPDRFWPQQWLPTEPGFENANIHSFGYDSNWSSEKSDILNIHDFGRELMEEMRNSHHLRDHEERPIVMVGHSMGGLVIKKVFILSQEISNWKRRIKSIFFLATPHKGSNYAAILNNLLTISGTMSPRQYIGELAKNSISLNLINDDFSKYAHEVAIVSFYETLKTKIGLTSLLIVERDSAVLGHGFRNEKVQFLSASHCYMSKFSDPTDPNYLVLKNSLDAAVQGLVKDALLVKADETREQMRQIKVYLGLSDRPAEYIAGADGSCQWLSKRDDFQEWRGPPGILDNDIDIDSRNLSIFWVQAPAGSGKTYLAAHVVSQLQLLQAPCAFYYFHVGDQTSRSLAPLLRSLAYHMALSNTAIREEILKIYQDGSVFDMDDSWTIWTKIFKRGIMQVSMTVPQYWVIDAVNECARHTELFTMFKGEDPCFPLRIFLTSRPSRDLPRLIKPLIPTATVNCIDVPTEDTLRDISCYIQSRISALEIDNKSDLDDLAQRILKRSNACFLWVRLVMDELERVVTTASMSEILDSIPEAMIPYYQRAIIPVEQNSREKHIAKAVFAWIVVSAREMTTSELAEAVELDIAASIPPTESAIEALCGQLISVDKESKLVGLIHPTAREFLLSDGGGFTVFESDAHARIARACLKFLSSSELRAPRNPRFVKQVRQTSSAFFSYAMENFSEHVYAASSEADELLASLDNFFKTNALSWIERVARTRKFHILIRTSKNLKSYLDRGARYLSPLSTDVKNIDNWATDLHRLVTEFGETLARSPSSIYFQIPPLCPTSTAIFRQFGKSQSGLVARGYKSTVWDDCIAQVSFREDIAVAVFCGDSTFAVGMESGDIYLYNQRSCQKESVIHHTNPVDIVHVMGSSIISCTTRAIIFQSLEGITIWENKLRFRCLYITASEKIIFGVSQHGHLLEWDRASGNLLRDSELKYHKNDVDAIHNHLVNRPPSVADISPDFELVALGYRGGTVCVWDIQAMELVGWAGDQETRLAAKLMFNPNLHLLLAIYSNHCLALYDTWSTERVQEHKSPHNAGFLSASCSPDGRTLATTDTHGNMNIWDFETLTVLYHIMSPFPSFRILSFASDGSSVLDIMDSNMRVWVPAALVRKTIEEDASISDDAIQLTISHGEYEKHKNDRVNVVAVHPELPLAVAGKQSGEVIVFTTTDDEKPIPVYNRGKPVTLLSLSRKCFIASSDDESIVSVLQYNQDNNDAVPVVNTMVIAATCAVKQLCFSHDGKYLLISTVQSDRIYCATDGHCVGTWEFTSGDRAIWSWLAVEPGNSAEQIYWLIADGNLKCFSISSFPVPLQESGIQIPYSLPQGGREVHIPGAMFHEPTQTLAVEVAYVKGYASTSTVFLFKMERSCQDSTVELVSSLPIGTAKECKHLLGWSEPTQSFVFLTVDSWVSSISGTNTHNQKLERHFLVPRSLLSRDVAPAKAYNDDLILCSDGELTSISNGLKFHNTAVW